VFNNLDADVQGSNSRDNFLIVIVIEAEHSNNVRDDI
jgi:hypothetical protein